MTASGESRETLSSRRRTARLAAVQALYQIDMTAVAARDVIDEFIAYRFGSEQDGVSYGEADLEVFRDIVEALSARRADIDRLVGEALDKGRTLDRLEAILRAILRAATYELLARVDVPARVVIDEYVDLAHAFFDGPQPRFVNGVLDRLARTLRPGELVAQRPGAPDPAA